MKKLLFIFNLILLLCISCKQKEFDLADLRFPIAKQQLHALGIKTDGYKRFTEGQVIEYISDSSLVMRFGGVSLAENLNRYNKHIYSSNIVRFLEDPKDESIQAYRISIQTTEEAEPLENYFDTQFGKTDFYYRDQEVSCRVWEKEGQLYYLGINFDLYDPERIDKHLKTAYLFVVNKNRTTLIKNEAPQGSYFRYYQSYLEEKMQPEHKTLTYPQFMELRRSQNESEGFPTEYFNHYIKP